MLKFINKRLYNIFRPKKNLVKGKSQLRKHFLDKTFSKKLQYQ